MRHVLSLALCFVCLPMAAWCASATVDGSGLTSIERQREITLRNRLCANKNLTCDYVDALFADPRLTLYPPPEPSPEHPVVPNPTHERNPYLTERFGLLTSESFERCRSFIAAHAVAFDAAFVLYGVPREIICGHLRLETDFGIPTTLTPHPLGTVPAFTRLVSLYVRRPLRARSDASFARRQAFAVNQLTLLLRAAVANGWDLLAVPGSQTGAIGLAQFEPSAFSVAVDGDGDGKIDLFDPEDAILSIAHYLVTRGWDGNLDHQRRAIYAYYGGHYDRDPNKFYMKAVLKYSGEVRSYLQDHPVEEGIPSAFESTPFKMPLPFDVPELKSEESVPLSQLAPGHN